MAEEEKIVHACGASSTKVPPYHLIPLEGLDCLANRFGDGAVKHGAYNWMNGIGNKEYVIERLNHVIRHAKILIEKVEGQRPWDEDDDAGAIAWGGVTVKVMLKGIRP